MKTVTLKRVYDNGEYTVGVLIYRDPICLTMELSWKDNKHNISCIPTGEYNVVYYDGKYHLDNVENRTFIEMHTGNTIDDIKGCILFGTSFGRLGNKFAVLGSAIAMAKFKSIIGDKFKLKII